MPDPKPPLSTLESRLVLRRGDQVVAMVVIALALAGIVGHWLYHGGHRGQMLEVDRVSPGTIAFTVDINQAPWPELTVLPGVGETLAKRIVESRELEGDFHDLGELRRVRGIGPRTLERLRPYLRPLPDLESTAQRNKSFDPIP